MPKGGVGLIIIGATHVHQSSIMAPLLMRQLFDGRQIEPLSTANMLFDIASLISFASRFLTLLPGAVLATGTPGGTGWGQDPELGGTGVTPEGCEPGRYLEPGDTVESEVERVDRLTFEVVE